MEMAKRLQAMRIAKYQGLTRRSGTRTIWNGVVREDRAAQRSSFDAAPGRQSYPLVAALSTK
jgi:protein gp37